MALGRDLTEAVLTDWHTVPIARTLRATIGFLEALTLSPDRLGPRDVAAMRETGVTDVAIMDAAYVCAVFNVTTRIANALDFEVPSATSLERAARFFLRFGYSMLSGVSFRGTVAGLHRADVASFAGVDVASSIPYQRPLDRLTNAVLLGAGSL